ncbi:MAG: hypothetical protein HQL95_09360 [Magnetococcales bacterium]|nr:hypothetical protein [Magnetococcales bacterium]
MKRLSCEKRLRWIRLSKERERRNLASVRKKAGKSRRSSRIVAPQSVSYRKGKTVRKIKKRIEVPSNLCLRTNYDEIVNFVIHLRKEVAIDSHAIFVDFSKLQNVMPDAALLLAAELDRWRRLRGVRLKVRKINKWHHEARSVLQKLGLFELLEVSNVPQSDDIVGQLKIIKFSANNTTDGRAAKLLRTSLEKVSGFNIVMSNLLYGGITEAMANVTQHAYPEEDDAQQTLKYWWLTGAYDISSDHLSVFMLDQGIGIPATLPNKYPMELLNHFLSKLGRERDDGSLIEAALAIGRTKTDKKYRGRGLENIMKFIKNNPRGELRILSRYGEYVFSSETNKSCISNHSIAFPGTLIHWQINLKSATI